MSNFESENHFDGDWDDRGELAWNEFDWQQFLKRHDQEIAKFLSFYENLKAKPEHLDEVAHMMGWDREDFGPMDPSDTDDSAFGSESDSAEIDSDDTDPYTVHRHPVFIVTRALYLSLAKRWERYALSDPGHASTQQVWRFSRSISDGEMNAILAIQALDAGDLALAVSHFKMALSALNGTFGLIQELPVQQVDMPRFNSFREDALVRLFDLREVWLRVMRDCRDEDRRRFNDGE